jgi:hypothetical protein
MSHTTAQIPGTPDSLLGTQRMRRLRPHPVQWHVWHDIQRFKVITAGRRSGKTELAKRKIVACVLDSLNVHEGRRPGHAESYRYAACGPTMQQAKDIWWSDLKALVPPEYVKAVNETELAIRMNWGAEIRVYGMDKPERIEGSPLDGVAIDEFANIKNGTFASHILPMMAERKGWAWLLGVPDCYGQGQADYLMYRDKAASRTDHQWRWYTWESADILDKAEVEALRASMDQNIFEQEFRGRFVLPGGAAFPKFDPAVNCPTEPPVVYDPHLPLCWSLDFNINPMCSGIIQHLPAHQEVRVLAELALPDTRTQDAADAFVALCKDRGWSLNDIRIYGDATGEGRQRQTGQSDWYAVCNRLGELGVPQSAWGLYVPSSNPEIKDTINSVNARICDGNNVPHLFIDPSCKHLISDLRTAVFPSKTRLEENHCLAWLRYFIHREYPVLMELGNVAEVA